MVIYLRHFLHGEKVAISELEAEMDRENGWEDFDPSTAPDNTETPKGRRTKA
jgi:hypothetical protein